MVCGLIKQFVHAPSLKGMVRVWLCVASNVTMNNNNC